MHSSVHEIRFRLFTLLLRAFLTVIFFLLLIFVHSDWPRNDMGSDYSDIISVCANTSLHVYACKRNAPKTRAIEC